MTCTPGRRRLLCAQPPGARALTGIDFVLVNPADHRDLAVFFVVEPSDLDRPVDTAAAEFAARITGREDGEEIATETTLWQTLPDAAGRPRLALRLRAALEGGFQTYRLALTDLPGDGGASRLDPFCFETTFSFKQPCPTPFDCAPLTDCPAEPDADYPVDYLARDFESFRATLMAQAEARFPGWEARVPADFGGMVADLFAALGDEFSWLQDRIRAEGHLETLTEPRSLDAHLRLIDHVRDPGATAATLVTMTATGGALVQVPAGARVWAAQEDRPPLPFEVGETVAQMVAGAPAWPVHPAWADIPAWIPDPDTPCLAPGARSLTLAGAGLLSPPFPPEVPGADIAGYWVGRQLLIETRPDTPDAPIRRALVTLDRRPEAIADPLQPGGGALLRLHWRAEDALPWPLDLAATVVSANLVPVRAGLSATETFATGRPADPGLAATPRTVLRAGPARADGSRPAIHRFTLPATVTQGLGWRDATDGAGTVTHAPEAVLGRLDPDLGLAPAGQWRVVADPLDPGAQDEALTLEAGRWGPVFATERRGERIRHVDYIDGQGWTLRFGTGGFGRAPVAGDLYRVTYRTGPGAAANLPEGTITGLTGPEGMPPPLHPLPPGLATIRNPFAVTDGRDPEPLDRARRIAPAAARSRPLRAVRDDDYRAQIERLGWVQQARATTRWTGSWATTLVTADPQGAYAISPGRLGEMRARLSAVRQVGRPTLPRQPRFTALDLKIAICIAPDAAFGHVAAAVIAALDPRAGGLFAPDRLSFGDALTRADLEAAISAAPGVVAVRDIRLRQRGRTRFTPFPAPALTIAADRILKLENDPDRPGQGSIRVYHDAIPAEENAA